MPLSAPVYFYRVIFFGPFNTVPISIFPWTLLLSAQAVPDPPRYFIDQTVDLPAGDVAAMQVSPVGESPSRVALAPPSKPYFLPHDVATLRSLPMMTRRHGCTPGFHSSSHTLVRSDEVLRGSFVHTALFFLIAQAAILSGPIACGIHVSKALLACVRIRARPTVGNRSPSADRIWIASHPDVTRLRAHRRRPEPESGPRNVGVV